MPVKFQCPECRSRLTVASRYAGRRGRCPKCQSKIDVPDRKIKVGSESESSATDLGTNDEKGSDDRESLNDSQEIATIELKSLVSIPRWVIYFQGALLGIIATTFFLFGLMVGLKTQVVAEDVAGPSRCVVSGRVYYDTGNYRRPDFGAVVILLPADIRPDPRPEGDTLTPESFVPLDNPSIEVIQDLGGQVVRVNDDASYQATLDTGQSYWILVISKNKASEADEISKQIRAELGAYFFPIEDLLDDRAFDWSNVKLISETHHRPDVVF